MKSRRWFSYTCWGNYSTQAVLNRKKTKGDRSLLRWGTKHRFKVKNGQSGLFCSEKKGAVDGDWWYRRTFSNTCSSSLSPHLHCWYLHFHCWALLQGSATKQARRLEKSWDILKKSIQSWRGRGLQDWHHQITSRINHGQRALEKCRESSFPRQQKRAEPASGFFFFCGCCFKSTATRNLGKAFKPGLLQSKHELFPDPAFRADARTLGE